MSSGDGYAYDDAIRLLEQELLEDRKSLAEKMAALAVLLRLARQPRMPDAVKHAPWKGNVAWLGVDQ